jgi:hypothetical protein
MSEPPKEGAPIAVTIDALVDEATSEVGAVKADYRLAIKPRPRKGETETSNQSHWLKTLRAAGEPRWRTNDRRSR